MPSRVSVICNAVVGAWSQSATTCERQIDPTHSTSSNGHTSTAAQECPRRGTGSSIDCSLHITVYQLGLAIDGNTGGCIYSVAVGISRALHDRGFRVYVEIVGTSRGCSNATLRHTAAATSTTTYASLTTYATRAAY